MQRLMDYNSAAFTLSKHISLSPPLALFLFVPFLLSKSTSSCVFFASDIPCSIVVSWSVLMPLWLWFHPFLSFR